jgi:hypothetical protein
VADDAAGLQVIDVSSCVFDLCAADVDGDGSVGFNDLSTLLGLWGPCPNPQEQCGDADIDEDGSVGFNDLTLLLGNWGPC